MAWAELLGGLELASLLLYLAFAAAVALLGPRRPLTYLLAALLAFFPVRDIVSALDDLLRSDPVLSYNASILFVSAVYLFAFLHLAFLSRAVDSPLTRPLRSRVASGLLLLGALAALVLPFVLHASLMTGPFPHAEGGVRWEAHAGLQAFSPVTYFVPALFSVVAAIDAFRRAPPGSSARRRSRAYLIAFLAWDVMLIAGSIEFFLSRGEDGVTPWSPPLILIGTVASFVFPFLLGRAFLREQLFDFDLKVKWTLRRGTLVGFFAAAFFIAASIAEQWLQDRYGLVVGGIAVGLLLFALRPLERVADRLANAAMPTVQATPAYVAHKKLEVYKAAVESAAETGGITARERASLDRLRQKLGIAEADARAVELEVLPSEAPAGYEERAAVS